MKYHVEGTVVRSVRTYQLGSHLKLECESIGFPIMAMSGPRLPTRSPGINWRVVYLQSSSPLLLQLADTAVMS